MRRRLLLAAIVLIVVLGHLWMGRQIAQLSLDRHAGPPPLQPVEVTIGGALKPMQPPRRPRPAPQPIEAAAVSPMPTEGLASASSASDLPAPMAPPPAMPEPPPAEAVAAAPPEAAASAAATAALADPWPPSTRIRYRLRGNYRGEFGGSAQVLWLRDGERYRVELEVVVGPRAAPVFSRRVISEGLLGPTGLVPARYEEDTRVIFSRARRNRMVFEPGAPGQAGTVVLQDGSRRPAPVGTQDSASQFVQLAWLFGTQVTPVKPGDRVSVHLALPRRSDLWTYVVGEPTVVDTPAGPVQTLHARPQRELDPLRRDLLAEVWFAPTLQYLPVRMQVMLDADTFAMMVMEGLPEVVTGGLGPPGERPAGERGSGGGRAARDRSSGDRLRHEGAGAAGPTGSGGPSAVPGSTVPNAAPASPAGSPSTTPPTPSPST